MEAKILKIIEKVSSAVLEELNAHHYSELTIKPYKRCLALLYDFCLKQGRDYCKEIGAEFVAMMTIRMERNPCKNTWFNSARCIRMIDSYLNTGKVDLSRRKKTKSLLLSLEFNEFLKSWDEDMKDRDLAPSTRESSLHYPFGYFCFLEDNAIYSLEAATASNLIDFIKTLRKTHSTFGSRTPILTFRRFIKFTGRSDLLSVFDNFGLERERNIMPLLMEEDLNAVNESINSNDVTLRDKAITLLALTTGLRACDIVNLRLVDIDWHRSLISTVQQKTGNPLSLPLLPTVGNSISEYLLNERPKSKDRCVFLSTKAPYKGLSGHAAIYRIIRYVFKLASVEAPYYGTRLTRHNAATRMLVARTPSPTISAVLGHVDPSSADNYITVDAEGMRACVLPLPKAVLQ